MPLPTHKRTLLAGALATGLAIGGVSMAEAAPQSVDDVTLTWALSQEAGGGTYFGGCNFLSAGKAGNTGSSRPWTSGDNFYRAAEGNVSILKDGASGPVAPTWDTKCFNAAGTSVSPAPGSSTNNRVQFTGGEGRVDLAAGTATVSWEGSFTSAFYGGMTYWHASDPTLTVSADGKGTLKATVGGYGTSMDDMSQWGVLTEREVTLANLSGVSLSEDGLTINPDYLGVVLTGITGQATTGANAGSFPQDFVEFHEETGQAAYWYSSGGSADPKKIAAPINIAWDATEAPEPEPEPSEGENVDVTVVVPEGSTPEPGVLKLTVSGNANLGEAVSSAAGFTASGQLPEVTVSDTRVGGTWAVNGQLGAFTSTAGSIPASALGWTPALVSGTAQVGAAVTPNSPGLGVSSTLGSGSTSEATLKAALTLVAPGSTPAGNYAAKLTLTAVG